MVSLRLNVMILLVFLLVFVVGSFYLTWKRRIFSRPDYSDLLLIEDIRHSKHRFPRHPSKVVTGGTYAQPFLTHWILSFLPKDKDVPTYSFFKPVVNVLFMVLTSSLTLAGVLTLEETVVAAGIFVFTPSFTLPEERGVSKRTAGALVVSVSLLSLLFWFETGNWGFLVISAVTGGMVHLTYSPASYFYVGTTVLLSISFGFFSFAVLLASIVLATVFSGGAYLRILYAEARSWYDGVFRQYVYSYGSATRPKLVVNGFVHNPFVVAVIGIYAHRFSLAGISNEPIPGTHLWIGVGLIGFLCSIMVGEEFAGNPCDYLQFTFLPGVVVVACGWSSIDAVYGALVFLSTLTGVAVIYVYGKRASRNGDGEWREVIEFLGEQKEGVVMVHPSVRGLELAYRTPHNVLDYVGNAETDAYQTRSLFPSNYLHFTDDIFMLKYRYNPDWLVIEKTISGDGILSVPESVKPFLENQGYAVYSFEDVYQAEKTAKWQKAIE